MWKSAARSPAAGGGPHPSIHLLRPDQPPVRRGYGGAADLEHDAAFLLLARRQSLQSPLVIFAIESSEGLGQAIDGATDDADVVRALQVVGQHRLGGEVLEILGEDLPAAPLALAMLCSLEQVLDPVVRPRHEPDPAAGALRQADRMAPEALAVSV